MPRRFLVIGLLATAIGVLGCSSSSSTEEPAKPIAGTVYGYPFTAKMAMARVTRDPAGAPITHTIEIFQTSQTCSSYASRYSVGFDLKVTLEARDGATTNLVEMISESGSASGANMTIPTRTANVVLVKAATVPSKGLPDVEGSKGHLRIEATGPETNVAGEIDYELCY